MFKSEPRPAFRLKYFECKKGSLHDGQVLNYVCIQKKCQQKGLICSVCKNDHNGHHVIPLKYLLDKLKSHQVKQIQSQIFQQGLQQLQEIKNGFLFELKSIVQKFAQHIQKIQENIIQLYTNSKVKLLNQIQMNMKFNQIIQLTLANNITNQQSFEKDFKIIASLINSNNQQQKDKSKNDNISFSINLKNIVKDYESNFKSFSSKINKFLIDSQPVLQDIMIFKNEQKLQIKQSSSQSNIKLSPNSYKFSSTMKGKNMILSNSDKTGSCTATGSQRFILIQGPVQKKDAAQDLKQKLLKIGLDQVQVLKIIYQPKIIISNTTTLAMAVSYYQITITVGHMRLNRTISKQLLLILSKEILLKYKSIKLN